MDAVPPASVGETGDMVDAQLRNGSVHTATGTVELVGDVVEGVRVVLAEEIDVRLDAGFPSEELFNALEEKGSDYVCRIRNNSVLKDMAEDVTGAFVALGPSENGEPRTMGFEEEYRAGSWSRPRRVLQVPVERVGELFPTAFNLVTSIPEKEMSGEEVLELYRRRDKGQSAHGQAGQRGAPGTVVAAAEEELSRHEGRGRGERGRVRVRRSAILDLEARVRVVHALRGLMAKATGVGWSLTRLRERALRTAARFTVSGRRVTMTASKVVGAPVDADRAPVQIAEAGVLTHVGGWAKRVWTVRGGSASERERFSATDGLGVRVHCQGH